MQIGTVLKTIEMEDNGYFGIGNDYKKPYNRCQGFFWLRTNIIREENFLNNFLQLMPPNLLRNEFQPFVESKMFNF